MDKWLTMAESYSHKFGQIIGDLLEGCIQAELEAFAKRNNLYLDKKGERKTRKGKKLTWVDNKNNSHDLDFVLEKHGTDDALGVPVAFIETAWRRYTKHSRNKAQEIQGAIIPLAEKHNHSSPFLGAILAGEFTAGSLTQLRSLNFSVLYFPYNTVVEAFHRFGIDASFDENTPEDEFIKKLEAWDRLDKKDAVPKELLKLNNNGAKDFFQELEASISRKFETIIIWPLHGKGSSVKHIDEAIDFLNKYQEEGKSYPLVKFEIILQYNNGTKIDAVFMTRKEAIEFLALHAGKQ